MFGIYSGRVANSFGNNCASLGYNGIHFSAERHATSVRDAVQFRRNGADAGVGWEKRSDLRVSIVGCLKGVSKRGLSRSAKAI